ncbi:hypothetical protein HEB94_000322 [Actinopolymorpha pittospori]|uniref:Uncharacterized protein n=1 Tax=Actinopolymorpha pittospori TaxID=648752 RepID=A0A927MMX4_9ACTN|nr:hypothetical protein [Actinopolymorpha pittospori]
MSPFSGRQGVELRPSEEPLPTTKLYPGSGWDLS